MGSCIAVVLAALVSAAIGVFHFGGPLKQVFLKLAWRVARGIS